jgi:hypothetical protein
MVHFAVLTDSSETNIKNVRRVNMVNYVVMYENGKMRTIETIVGIGEVRLGERRMKVGVNSTMIYCKNFYKCHNLTQHNNMII